MLPPNEVKYGKIEGVVDQPLEPLPEGAEYPHQLDSSSAEDGPPSRLEFEALKLRVAELDDLVSRLFAAYNTTQQWAEKVHKALIDTGNFVEAKS